MSTEMENSHRFHSNFHFAPFSTVLQNIKCYFFKFGYILRYKLSKMQIFCLDNWRHFFPLRKSVRHVALKWANIAWRQQMTTLNLLQKHFKQLWHYTVSDWYLLHTAAISNQMKYYLTINRGTFLEMQYGFYRYAL